MVKNSYRVAIVVAAVALLPLSAAIARTGGNRLAPPDANAQFVASVQAGLHDGLRGANDLGSRAGAWWRGQVADRTNVDDTIGMLDHCRASAASPDLQSRADPSHGAVADDFSDDWQSGAASGVATADGSRICSVVSRVARP